MKLRFFASPTDIRGLFLEIEQSLEICYVWGLGAPCLDVLNVFNSCNEIDCFGYALDPTYWMDIYFRDTKLNFVQNAGGYYISNASVQLHICNTATKTLTDRALKMNELYCPPGAEKRNQNLFLAIKRIMLKNWPRIDGILYGPEVFQKREHLVFLGDTTFSFSGEEQYTTSLEMWREPLIPKISNTPFLCSPPELQIHFYASSCDMLDFFRQLELHTSMRYWCGKECFRFEHFNQLFSERFQDDPFQKAFHAVDMYTHNTIDVTLGGLRADIKNVVAPGFITYMSGCPKYGGTLFRRLNKLFEEMFSKTTIKPYKTYYIGPEIFENRSHIIFDNGDPRFRWKDGELVNVWRTEWEKIIGTEI